MKLRIFARAAGLALGLCLLGTSLAHAEDKTAARTLATEGRNAYVAGDFARAAELFARAETHYHATVHSLLGARAHLELGHLVQARELLLLVVHEPLPAGASEIATQTLTDAKALLEELEPRIPRLVIQVSPAGLNNLVVTVDGKVVSADLVGIAAPYDPGVRQVQVSADGYESFSASQELKEGASETLEVTLVPRSQGATPAAIDAKPEAAAELGSSSTRIWAYSALGLGAVGVGVGATFLVLGSSDSKEADTLAEDDCASDGGSLVCDAETAEEIEDLDQAAASKRTVAVVGFSAGAALLATGVILFLLEPSGSEQGHHLRAPAVARPWVLPVRGGAALGFGGTFSGF